MNLTSRTELEHAVRMFTAYCANAAEVPASFLEERDRLRDALSRHRAAQPPESRPPAARGAEGGLVQLLTIHGAAEYLGLSERKVRQLEASGRLRAVRIDGAVRFQRSALEDFVLAHETPEDHRERR